MTKKLSQSNILECQEKFNLSYHVNFALWCEETVGFAGKNVLEVGGSLPEEFVFDYLHVKSWTALESPEYEDALQNVSDCSLASSLPKLSNYSSSELTNLNLQSSNYEFFPVNIENLSSEHYNKYDLIFSIAAFEHIHKFPTALEKMFLALKPGGKLFAVFAPIWSAHDGHHLPLLTEINQDRQFDFHNSPIPPWGHLLMRPTELCSHLYNFTNKETAELITYYVYNSPHINRFFTEDYVEFIHQSLFKIQRIEAIGVTAINPEIQNKLEELHPGRNHFANNGLLVILDKELTVLNKQNQLQVENTNSTSINSSVNVIHTTQVVESPANILAASKTSDKKPRIDVVLQTTGVHGWSFSQGWVNTLQRKGLLNRVFRPVAGWGAEEPLYDDGLFEYLQNPQADIILMLGFDWHSQPLHTTLKWQERWHQSPIIKIATVQECHSTNVVQNTPVWQQQMYQAIASAIPCVDGLICNHEPDVDFLKQQLGISLPMIFMPFAIDSEFFRMNKPFSERLNRALFRGNTPRYFTEESYKERHRLIEALSKHQNVDLFSNNLHHEKNPLKILEEYVQETNTYRIVLNLPSNSPTLTARPFEVIGCGSLLLQNKITGVESQKLLKDWEHAVFYDGGKPEDLIEKIEYLISNPDLAEKIAIQGYNLCHELHTLQCRITTLLDWINNNIYVKKRINPFVNRGETNNALSRFLSDSKADFTVIIDGVFFQLYQTGIARVWKSLLEEWANNRFAKHIVVLDRGGTAPKISGVRYLDIAQYDYNHTQADRKMLQQVCDELDADLFISSYYTTPLITPSVFMGYDMIPEVLGWDVINNPMWREKHLAIQIASAYIAISQHTARDINKYFLEIPVESVTVAHCGVSNTFSPAKAEEVNAFKAKYGINKPYFILVGAGNGYKNSMLFFQAFSQLASSYGFDIICTGSGGILADEFRAYTSGSAVYMLQLSDEELATAYSGAVALVYPSKYEGFGMPIVEAMACGCPVITCPNASIPEVGGEAVIYINDDDVNGLANALCDVQKPSIRQALIDAGLIQAQKFSWAKMANIVSYALINASLLSLNLREINLIVFPDWSQSEELIGLELESVIKAIATYPDSQKTTLLINTSNINTEDAELLLSGITMNLLMEEDLDISEGLGISLVAGLADIQWQALLPRISSRIILQYEDKAALAELAVESISACELESFINQLCVL